MVAWQFRAERRGNGRYERKKLDDVARVPKESASQWPQVNSEYFPWVGGKSEFFQLKKLQFWNI